MNGRGGFRFPMFPPGVPTRPPYPHMLDRLREEAAAARAARGHGMPYQRPDAHIPRQTDGGNAWDEDGSDRLPPPGWHQNPESAHIRGVVPRTPERATVRWGDTKELTLEANTLGPASQALGTYLLAVDLAMPAVGVLRLSAVSPDITVVTANWRVIWRIQTGVGQSQFEELHQADIAPANGVSPQTLSLTLPVQSLRVTAAVTAASHATGPKITVNAQWAPLTAYPDLINTISGMNKEEPVTG